MQTFHEIILHLSLSMEGKTLSKVRRGTAWVLHVIFKVSNSTHHSPRRVSAFPPKADLGRGGNHGQFSYYRRLGQVKTGACALSALDNDGKCDKTGERSALRVSRDLIWSRPARANSEVRLNKRQVTVAILKHLAAAHALKALDGGSNVALQRSFTSQPDDDDETGRNSWLQV